VEIAFVVNSSKSSTLRALARAHAVLGRDHRLVLAGEAAALLRKRADYGGEIDAWPVTSDVGAADALVALGGDGTLLHAVRLLQDADRPLLGVNLGSLGFLTDTPEAELEDALRRLVDGRYQLDRRMLLEARVESGARTAVRTVALNDVVVHGPRARVLEVGVRIGGTPLGRTLADGVIVATPSGSTAYNLSAGGPVVSPRVAALVLTPISAHALSQRPLVVGADEEIEITLLRTASDGAELTIDGQTSRDVAIGDRVIVRRAPRDLALVMTRDRTFYDTLRAKLGWGHRGRGG
jgi:NAD+ kinase